MNNTEKIKADLKTIFLAGVKSVDPYQLIKQTVSLENETLHVSNADHSQIYDLAAYERIIVIGFGKASAKMAAALETILGARISDGLIVVKYGHTEKLNTIKVIEAGHPIPDDNGIQAAQKIINLVKPVDSKTLVIALISGGGSALIPYPYAYTDSSINLRMTLENKQTVTKSLLGCGATINEINCVRKHLSCIKGGRLTQVIAPAHSLNLILSDVVGDHLYVIASGATEPDPSYFYQMNDIINKYNIRETIPVSARNILDAGMRGSIPETPKPNDPIFQNTNNFLIGTNRIALKAACSEAESLGYQTFIHSSELIGEARQVAQMLWSFAKKQLHSTQQSDFPVCLLSGGETTVTIKGDGKGGRNQEMALSFLNEMAAEPEIARRIAFLSAGTDGNDGPTDAAGAFATYDILKTANIHQLKLSRFLQNNDSYGLFKSINGLLITGPTNTNVCDIQVILIDR